MALTEAQRFHLKKFVKELEKYRGRHTELVSVYIPQNYDLNKIINHLAQEQGTASNIKSSATRKNVTDALERMIQHLKLFKRTPPNGLVVFSGNVAKREGQHDFQVWSIEPPVPLKTRIYRCDKEFVLDILRDMLESKEVYGLVVMDRRDANIALLKGKTIVPIVKTHSEVPGKFKAGGQSAARFSRLIEGAAKDHYKKVAEYMKEAFLTMEGLKGIIVGGPGPTKYDLVEGDFITNEVKKKIIAIRDLSYTEEFGLEELLEKSQDVLAKEEVTDEKKIVGKFLELLATKQNKVSYGENDVKNKLQMGAVDTLLLSEALSDEKIEELENMAKPVGSTVKIISTETREGVQLRDLGKVAAILRYEVHT
ncbi:peptide chain release factor 1 [Candidatus Woesearchaeota archaeon]|jgi:peptide chain release factor subunit 1|nr:peptide chain release factor 1 [Candidatus Woesearchaeota archaeon]MDP6648034.1 peptide chain release factor aRF-1 [Candidatus Woesearchaeota archaeon]|tara:strand:- start:41197 stop:42297 length:1101 start_codon:yes stop_codon:yes gene_type:complete